MAGNYNGYPGFPAPTTSVLVGGSATNLAMEPLVDQFGNLRFNNQIIPLTTPITPFISQTPSMPNLTSPPISPPISPQFAPQQPGPFYVVSVQESTPPNVSTQSVSTHKPYVQAPNNFTVGKFSNGNSKQYESVINVGHPHRQGANGALIRQRNISNPDIKPPPSHLPVQRRVSAPEPNADPFRGQPYMRQFHVDHSTGEVIRNPEPQVPPLTAARFVMQPHIEEIDGVLVYVPNGVVSDGTDTSSMSSTSVSPYSSMPSSPRSDLQGLSDTKVVYDPVPPRYAKPSGNSRCLVCDKTVYAMEKMGPIKDVLFHKLCFKCAVCNMTLDLKNFCQNDNDLADLNVYCKTHKPFGKFGKLDSGALSINRALKAPRLAQVNEQLRGGQVAARGGKVDLESLNIKSALNAPKQDLLQGDNLRRTSHNYHIDNETVSMVHARSVPATELQGANKSRQQVWSRDKRRAEGVPPPDVIRHDTELQDYGGEPYRHDPPPESSYRNT